MTSRSFTVVCVGCGASQQLYDYEHTELYACSRCLVMQRKDGTGTFRMAGSTKKATLPPVIRVGAEGVLDGRPYQVICYAQRREHGSQILWQEYILLDKETGEYRFLSEFQGHWQLLSPIAGDLMDEKAMDSQQQTVYEGETYKLYNKYSVQYEHAEGEFFWDMQKDPSVKCREYICPPQILVQEKSKTSTDYFLGRHIDGKTVQQAFALPYVPMRVGVGALQPFSRYLDVGRFSRGAVIFCILIIVLQYLLNMQSKELVVLNETFTVNDSTVGKPKVLPSFSVAGRMANLQIDAYAKVQNSWVEAEVALVNEKTGEETGFATGVEYYSGIDDGESWSEGGWSKSELICAVAPGTYHFVVTPAKELTTIHTDMTLIATWDIPTWWNAIWACVIMGASVMVLYFLEKSFEKNRWYNSDYSPYEYDN